MRLAILLSALLLAGAATADDAPPPIRSFDIPTVEKLAHDMYAQDQEAWKATDILRAQVSADQKPHGWVVVSRPDGDVVRFIRDGASGPEVWCDIAFNPDPTSACTEPQDHALAPAELAQYNARILALKNVERRCSDTYNTIALKDPERDGWLVWAMAATTVPGEIVYGGHYRFTVSPDGKAIVERDALSRACVTFPPPDPSKGKDLLASFFVQLVAPIPVETTVFLSMQSKTPFVISTPDRKLWIIANGTVTQHGELPAK